VRQQDEAEVWRWERDRKLVDAETPPSQGNASDRQPVLPSSAASESPSGAETGATRFWSHVDRSGGPQACWPWTGAMEKKTGYGRVKFRGKARMAHRVAYELAVGPIPAGLQVDHVRARGCRRRDCVNPAHLEAVSQRENILRGTSPHVVLHNLKVCAEGHAVTGENRKLRGGTWQCRTCFNADRRAWRARKRARVAS